METNNNVTSINQAMEAAAIRRDASPNYIKSDKFFVKVTDDKGNVYEIRYFL